MAPQQPAQAAGPRRLQRLAAHLTASAVSAPRLSAEDMVRIQQISEEFKRSSEALYTTGELPTMSVFDVRVATRHELDLPTDEEIAKMVEEAEESGRLRVLDLVPGPWREARAQADRVALCREVQLAFLEGRDIFLFTRWQQQYGGRGLSSNIGYPKIQPIGKGTATKTAIIARVLLGDPEDAERISRLHVRKEGNFEMALFDSIISTTDNDHWERQRKHLSEAFLPLSTLAKILPVSLARAKTCADRLAEASAGGRAVDMSDFLLHEAQAQLQLALLGAPESLMEATNADIRATFLGDMPHEKVGVLGKVMQSLMKLAREDSSMALPSDGCPVHGPLSRALQTSGMPASTDYGNMLIVLFAGHDTTGHTMTWLLFELARHPELQRELQREVDAFFEALAGRDPTYTDLSRGLDLLDRCITETLRLWPAVPNGTYRQLQFGDAVRGPSGEPVQLPKGSFVQVANWPRHRNPELWGGDVDEFNPRRHFTPSEVARVGCPMAAATPQSNRYSPFAFAPRSCLGRNFAQLEMRLILLQLLRRFHFQLAAPYDRLVGQRNGAVPINGEWRGVNRGTMGPMDLEKSTEHSWGRRPLYAMKLHARPRA